VSTVEFFEYLGRTKATEQLARQLASAYRGYSVVGRTAA
jgi:hypothetical protein